MCLSLLVIVKSKSVMITLNISGQRADSLSMFKHLLNKSNFKLNLMPLKASVFIKKKKMILKNAFGHEQAV